MINTSSADLKGLATLNLTGNGEAMVFNSNGSSLVTVDASALGGTYTLGTDKGQATNGLFYFSENAKAETIKLGSGVDRIVLSDSTVKNVDVVMGLNLVDAAAAGKQIDINVSDILKVDAVGFERTTVTASSLNLALVDLAAGSKDAVVFAFGGDTYVYADNAAGVANNQVDDADLLVKITGSVDLDLLVSSLNMGV